MTCNEISENAKKRHLKHKHHTNYGDLLGAIRSRDDPSRNPHRYLAKDALNDNIMLARIASDPYSDVRRVAAAKSRLKANGVVGVS